MEIKIPDKAWDFFSDVSKTVKSFVFLGIFCFAGFVIYALYVKKEDPVPDLTNQQKDKIAVQNVDIDKRKDSIIARYKRLENIDQGVYRDEINKECVRIQQRLKYCTRVDFWKIRSNWQEDTKKYRPLSMVLISSSDNFQFDYKYEKEVPDGYYYFATKILSDDIYLVEDVTNNGHIYYDPKTASFFKTYSTKAVMGGLVTGNATEWYVVTFSFSEINPMTYNNNLGSNLRNFRRFVQKRTVEP